MDQLFDGEVRFGTSLYGYQLDTTTLLEQMTQTGIGRAVLCPVHPRSSRLAEANDAVARAVAEEPDRFVGVARINPWLADEALEELERAVTQLGLRGLYLDPWEERFVISSEIVDLLIERAVDFGLPILVTGGYTNFSHPSQLAELARRHREATFIATHGGQLNISGLLLADAQMMLRDSPNILINTSGVYREDFIEDCIAEFGADRVVFGSGAPIFDQAYESLRIRHAHVSEETKRQIGFGNLARLLDEGE